MYLESSPAHDKPAQIHPNPFHSAQRHPKLSNRETLVMHHFPDLFGSDSLNITVRLGRCALCYHGDVTVRIWATV